MKFLVSIFLTAVLAYSLGLYMPWWSIALAACAVSVMLYQSPGFSALTGFLGIFLFWCIMSWIRSKANQDILAHRISLFILKKDQPVLLIMVTGLLGGLTGALGALTGSLARRAFFPLNKH
jgi:hypothetical protein